jgi:hypothetical protein
LVQNPAAEVEVHVDVEAMLNLAVWAKVRRRGRMRSERDFMMSNE